MKYTIVERCRSLSVFIESENMKFICKLADSIAESNEVVEVIHNRKTKHGCIILNKDSDSTKNKIELLLNSIVNNN